MTFEGVSLGILFFRWNGIFLALGILAGAAFSLYEVKRRREERELIYYLFTPLILCAMIGARAWHVFTPSLSAMQLGLTTEYYLSHWIDILAVWVGGYGIPGAWIGGLIALMIVSRQNDIPFWDLADLLAPGFALAHLIGRLGNYFNQELYGLPTTLPWKIFIAPEYRLTGYESAAYYHPLFAYEAILSLLCFAMLIRLSRKYLPSGNVFLAYVMFYSAARALLEFLRLDVALIHGLNINQIFFAGAFALAALLRFAPRQR